MLKFYFNPVSSYSQKVLIAFYEKNVEFKPEIVDLFDPASMAAFKKVSPMGKLPFLKVESKDWNIPESSIIIEYLDTHYDTGTRLIPSDKDLSRQMRFHDRCADLYLNNPMAKILLDGFKAPDDRDPKGVAAACATLDSVYPLIDRHFANSKGPWVMGEQFTMADCATAPALGYLRQVHSFEKFTNLTAYFNRVNERPSFARVQKEAAPILAKMMAPKG